MKIKCLLFFSFLVLFFLTTNISFSQDTTFILFPKESALKKGNYALVFELGTIFGNSNFFEAFSLTAKKHLSDKLALRVSFGGNFYAVKGNGDNYEYRLFNRSFEDYSDNFQTTINFQYFLNINSKIKPFVSIGPYAEYSYSGTSSKEHYDKSETWRIGLFASLGTEMFITDNISLIGEYILRSTYGIHSSKYFNIDINNFINGYSYEYNKEYRFSFNSARIGFSVYF